MSIYSITRHPRLRALLPVGALVMVALSAGMIRQPAKAADLTCVTRETPQFMGKYVAAALRDGGREVAAVTWENGTFDPSFTYQVDGDGAQLDLAYSETPEGAAELVITPRDAEGALRAADALAIQMRRDQALGHYTFSSCAPATATRGEE